MMKKNLKTIGVYLVFGLALLMFFAALQPAIAQVGPGGGGNPCPGGEPCDPENVPISGIEWLLAAGGLLGIRMARKRFKQQT
jgi:hypothetical protein